MNRGQRVYWNRSTPTGYPITLVGYVERVYPDPINPSVLVRCENTRTPSLWRVELSEVV